jgi:hypothetical protein
VSEAVPAIGCVDMSNDVLFVDLVCNKSLQKVCSFSVAFFPSWKSLLYLKRESVTVFIDRFHSLSAEKSSFN